MTRTLIVVPMKDLFASKTRLAGTLSNSARNKLVHLLYEKTLNFLIPIAAMEKVEIAVVTKCKYAKKIAEKLSIQIIEEPSILDCPMLFFIQQSPQRRGVLISFVLFQLIWLLP